MMRRRNRIGFRHLVLIAFLVMATAVSSVAQIFLLNEENNDRIGTGDFSNVITHGIEHDQTNYMPLDGGTLLLTVLGGAFLMKKRKK